MSMSGFACLSRDSETSQLSAPTVDSGTHSITYAYSPANRLTSAVSSDGVISTYLYDQSGNQTQVESSESGTTYLGWDARNQLGSVELPAGTVTFTYK